LLTVLTGKHPNLIPVHGKLIGHPEATPGLVMARIDPTCVNLAGPPSLESCTRDVYAPATRFTLETALGIARGIAGAAQHLHQRGILHGDLYGHNILHGGQGQVVIGDFGAASFYSLADAMTGIALERLEVRAFGCLLAEMVERIDPVFLPEPIQRQLSALVTACLGEIPAERPRFADILQQLAGINPQATRRSLP
jgi:serine/threonine protein kinase